VGIRLPLSDQKRPLAENQTGRDIDNFSGQRSCK
jgi:hypothetical protein